MSLGATAVLGVATALDSVNYRPVSNLVLDFFILGKIPFTSFRITFDMIFMPLMAILIYFTLKKLWSRGKSIVENKLDLLNYYNAISI